MKILIVSDSHGRNNNLIKVIDKVKPIDLMIHLGDFEGSEDTILQITPCQVEMVRGNNDYYTSIDNEKVIRLGNHTIFLSHGHRYGVNFRMDTIKYAAQERQADIVIFGHTHRPLIDLSDNVWAINPGSITQPRQEGGIPTFIIMDIDKEGRAHFTLNYLKQDQISQGEY